MRFYGEKVFGLQISINSFVTNQKGYPILSEAHAKIFKEYMKTQTRFILTPRHPNDVLDRHYNYMTYLFSQHDKLDDEDAAEVSYRNYL